MKMEEDCLVLNLPDVEERICQVKEEPRRTRIEAKRFREGWTRMPLVSVSGRKRRAKGGIRPPVLINEKASPRCSSRKNPPETDHEDGRELSNIESPQRGGADLPGQRGSEMDKKCRRSV